MSSSRIVTNMGDIGKTLSRELTKAAKHNRELVARHMQRLPYDAERMAVDYYDKGAKLRRRSRQLARATEGFSRESGSAVTAGLRNAMVYAAAHNFGTGPYTIRAKRGKLLKFRGPRGWVSKKEVKHPGQKRRNFLNWPLREAGSDMLARIREEVGFG